MMPYISTHYFGGHQRPEDRERADYWPFISAQAALPCGQPENVPSPSAGPPVGVGLSFTVPTSPLISIDRQRDNFSPVALQSTTVNPGDVAMRQTPFMHRIMLVHRTMPLAAIGLPGALIGGLLGWVLWGLVAGFPSPALADEENPYVDVRLSRVSLIDGELLIQRGDDEEWTAASVNLPLRPHDRLWATDGARGEVQFDDGVAVQIAENTSLDLLGLDPDLTHLQLTLGVASISTPASHRRARDESVELDTPQASLQLAPASNVRIDVAEDGSTVITVREGEATINRNEGPLTVAAHQRVAIEGGDAPRYELDAAAPDDAWDQWVDERTGLLAKAKSREHLGSDVAMTGDMGTTELDTYGRWDQVPTYGWVWVPRVNPGWVPYQAGRWIWREPWGWTWVSYEPWGWLPYHYGRWIVAPIGWVWVPGPTLGFWTPGCVRFIYGPDWVAWVPLGPGEIYYYYPPPGVVNVTLINYRTRGAVIVRSRREFAGGRIHTPFVPPKDPIRVGRVAFGPPPVVPTRASLRPFPSIEVHTYQLPPKVIARPVVFRHEPAPAPALFSERVKDLRATITKGRPPVEAEVGQEKRGQPQPQEPRSSRSVIIYRGVITHKTLPAVSPPSERERSVAPSKGESSRPALGQKNGQPSVPRQVEFGRPQQAPPVVEKGTRQQPKPLYERPPKPMTPGNTGTRTPDMPDSNRGLMPSMGNPRSR
jgi:hypothetical protein